MSESKLCPLALVVGYESATHLYCLREKCAWWVKEQWPQLHEEMGHCVALDWGKR